MAEEHQDGASGVAYPQNGVRGDGLVLAGGHDLFSASITLKTEGKGPPTMNRFYLALALLTLTSCGSGCAMCSSPYDDCGPVYDGGQCRNELIEGRAGSAFAAEAVEDTDEIYYEEE